MDSLITKVENLIREKFANETTGHDWWHIDRVRRNALILAKLEGADVHVTELAALLHDIADHKFHQGDLAIGPATTQRILTDEGASPQLVERIVNVVSEVSFKGAGVTTPVTSIEAACVQDADRLDAIGAIGVARAFAFGGSRHRLLYNPDEPPTLHLDFTAYYNDQGHTINHFYEKLLLLKDRMQTTNGKRLAEARHAFMEQFLHQFYSEWNAGK